MQEAQAPKLDRSSDADIVRLTNARIIIIIIIIISNTAAGLANLCTSVHGKLTKFNAAFSLKVAENYIYSYEMHKNCCHQSCSFWPRYAPNRLSAGASPQTPLGSL